MLASHNSTYPADPFTHTGLLATVTVNSQWTAQVGVSSGSDIFLGAAASPTLLSGVRWTAADSKTSSAVFAVLGSGRFNSQVISTIGAVRIEGRRFGIVTVDFVNPAQSTYGRRQLLLPSRCLT